MRGCVMTLRAAGMMRSFEGGSAMKDMLLHWSPRSPFVRKVMITAHECGLADRIETVRTVVAASQPNNELMKENPQSRLPTLRLADDTVIYDSPEEELGALAASEFSIAHLALGVAIGYIDFRFPELKSPEGHPKIAGWHA